MLEPFFTALSCFCMSNILWLVFFWWNSFSAFQMSVGLVYLVGVMEVWNLDLSQELFWLLTWLISHKHRSLLVASWCGTDWFWGMMVLPRRYCSNSTASRATITAFSQVPWFWLLCLTNMDILDKIFMTSCWIVYLNLLVSGSTDDAVDSLTYGWVVNGAFGLIDGPAGLAKEPGWISVSSRLVPCWIKTLLLPCEFLMVLAEQV